jgi:hypothetical protein
MNENEKKFKVYKEVFSLLLNTVPPDDLIKGYTDSPRLAPENILELQNWCATEAKLEYLSGISIIDAADVIYKDLITDAEI